MLMLGKYSEKLSVVSHRQDKCALSEGAWADTGKRLADFRVGFCMLVRFASDRRNYQGGAKRNRRMQKLPKIELVLQYCLHLPLKMGELIRMEVQEKA
jgi:hypothetical protein